MKTEHTAVREVNVMGMTDLQFKNHLKEMIRALEWAGSKDTVEAIRAELDKLKQDLQETIES